MPWLRRALPDSLLFLRGAPHGCTIIVTETRPGLKRFATGRRQMGDRNDQATATPPIAELTDRLRDAMAHFYDFTHLMHSPLLGRLCPSADVDPSAAVQRLRRTLLEAIEELRPSADLSPDDPSWRPFSVVYERYVLGRELAVVEEGLSLGRRQIQREQRRAFEALAAILCHRHPGLGAQRGAADSDVAGLLTEIRRASSLSDRFDVGDHLARAIGSAADMAEHHGVSLLVEVPEAECIAVGNGLVFRQMLLLALSYLLRCKLTDSIVVRVTSGEKHVLCSMVANARQPLEETPVQEDLPETLVTLAESQGVQVAVESREGLRLLYRIPTFDKRSVILLVEDNQDLVALLSRYLSSRGLKLVGVSDATEALPRAREVKPDVVVLDVMMERLDGWEVLQRLRADPELCRLPIVVCSVLDDPDLAMDLGADAFLPKPVRPAQFLRCVTDFLPGKAGSEAANST